jgi:hypothetical protein
MLKLKPHLSVQQIAKKHRLDVSFIQKQLDMGEPIEHEHTKDHTLAMDIALQHLDEIPDYYTRLKKMEASAKKEHKQFKDAKVSEGNLHQWFKGSKSKDGKSGWVNVVTGGTCASDEPGEGTPKCVSSTKRTSMTKAERLSASKRKKAADPGQQQKTGAAKPTYVSTNSPEKKMNEETDKKNKSSGKKDACYTKVKSRYDVWPSAYASGALVRCRKVGAANWGTKSEAVEEQRYCPLCDKREPKSECSYGQKAWEDFSVKDHEYSMARSELSTVMNAAKRLQKKMGKGEGNIEAWVQSKITKAADYLDAAADYVASGEMSEANALGFEIKKSSGVGALTPNAAKQLGDKAVALQKKKAAAVALPKLKEHKGIVAEILKDIQEEDPCWKGYTQVGMKDKGGKKVPNCVPSKGKGYKEEVEIEEAVRLPATNGNIISVILSWRGRSYMTKMFFPQVKMPSRREVTDQIQKVYPGATILQYNLAGLEPGQPLIQVSDKSKNYLLNNKTIGEETEVSEVVYESGDYWHPDPKKDSAISGVGNKMRSREDRGQDTSAQTKPDYSNRLKPGETYMQFSKRKQAERTQKEEVAAWQRKEGKNQKGGLNEKGRKSYERENPGSDLKAPQPEGGSRRDSFCARMKGMKRKLTSAKTANDPDSRINKSLRAWNC